jgi:hypothetical protein
MMLVTGYPDYAVSEQGDVFRVLKHGRFRKLKKTKDHDGYEAVTFCVKNVRKRMLVHSLILAAFKGERPAGYVTRHLDGVRDNNRIDNLEWSTHLENIRDKRVHGTHQYGESVNGAKLTEADVVSIRAHPVCAGMFATMARRFNVTPDAIRYAYLGKTWAHLPKHPTLKTGVSP